MAGIIGTVTYNKRGLMSAYLNSVFYLNTGSSAIAIGYELIKGGFVVYDIVFCAYASTNVVWYKLFVAGNGIVVHQIAGKDGFLEFYKNDTTIKVITTTHDGPINIRSASMSQSYYNEASRVADAVIDDYTKITIQTL